MNNCLICIQTESTATLIFLKRQLQNKRWWSGIGWMRSGPGGSRRRCETAVVSMWRGLLLFQQPGYIGHQANVRLMCPNWATTLQHHASSSRAVLPLSQPTITFITQTLSRADQFFRTKNLFKLWLAGRLINIVICCRSYIYFSINS